MVFLARGRKRHSNTCWTYLFCELSNICLLINYVSWFRNTNENLLALYGIYMHLIFALFLLMEHSDFFVGISTERYLKCEFSIIHRRTADWFSVLAKFALPNYWYCFGEILQLFSVVKEQGEILLVIIQVHSSHAIIPFFLLREVLLDVVIILNLLKKYERKSFK